MTQELQPGDAFAGHRIDAVAGRGGMGVVYRATQLDLERTVALKLIAPSLAEDPLFRERFIRETRVAAGIDHPNVIPVFYAGDHEGRLYLAMRYVAGEDLRTLVRRTGPLDPARAARIIAQVAAALDAAHASGIVHRDVKPANVLLDAGDHAYLTDFGLTKRVHTTTGETRAGGWVGTLGYVSPEQIRGAHVDARSDVYALGCVLHHALTGSPPHQRDSDEATLWAHLHEPPGPLPSGTPPALEAVVTRALAKDPEDRFPSAGDLGRALLAATGVEHSAAPERMVATGAAAPPGLLPPVDEQTRASPAPAVGSQAQIPADQDETVVAAGRGGRRTHRSRPQLAFLAIATLSLAVVGVLVALMVTSGDDTPGSGTTTAPTTADASYPRAKVVDSFSAGSRPNDVVVTSRAVWVTSAGDALMTHIDPVRGRRVGTLNIGAGAGALATGYGRLWIAKHTGSLLVRDIETGHARRSTPIKLPPGLPVAVATGLDGVWVAIRSPGDALDVVIRFDPKTGRQVRRVAFPKGVQDMTVGYGYVWVTTRGSHSLLRVDPNSGDTGDPIDLGSGAIPKGVAAGNGWIWVCDSADNTVTRIDPRTKRFAGTLPTGRTPTGVDVGGGSVWIANEGDGTLTRINSVGPPKVRQTVDTDELSNPFAVAARGRDVWVTDTAAGSVVHLRF